MKDEELAEEWVSSEEYQRDRPIEPFSTDECSNDWAELAKYAEYMLPKAFLAGLKAQPKWHILAEEPNVLPEEGQKVKVLTEEGDIENSTYFYDTYYEEFAWSNIGLLKVFAWCEISTFDKE